MLTIASLLILLTTITHISVFDIQLLTNIHQNIIVAFHNVAILH
jgi:hypothetical protein